MLKKLKFNVTFPTGKHITQDIIFDGGTTAITGKNGKGKSLVLEMATYALFGSAAARGPSGDYSKCDVSLELSIRGEDYTVARSNGTKASLSRGNDILATGTTPVNAKVVELLGYDLSVFKVGNLVGQGEIEALTTMKPSERKRLIDTTIGLDALDEVAAWASNEAALFRKEAETLERFMQKPVRPEQPENYRESSIVIPLLDQAVADRSERDTLRGWLQRGQSAPNKPACPVETPSEELAKEVEAFQTKSAILQRWLKLPEAIWTKAQVEKVEKLWAKYDEWLVWEALPPYLDTNMAHIKDLRQQWADWKAYQKFAQHKTSCPKCEHEFIPGHAVAEVERPVLSLEALDEQERVLKAWEGRNPKNKPSPALKPDNSKAELEQAKAALLVQSEREELFKQIEGFTPDNDPTPAYKNRLAYEAQMVQYAKALEAFEAWEAEASIKRTRLENLSNVDEVFDKLNAEKASSLAYERMMLGYDNALIEYEEQLEQHSEAVHRAEQLKLGAAAMKELKLRIKTYLVPSLSKVATHLIQQMTLGQEQELTSVQVNEEFEITIDGQPVETLNGSGKTVANLAVRIGLGQILTNKMFSVLMADEVDAACDDERAAAIAGCLQGLTPNIQQVLIVSHKDIAADNQIEL